MDVKECGRSEWIPRPSNGPLRGIRDRDNSSDSSTGDRKQGEWRGTSLDVSMGTSYNTRASMDSGTSPTNHSDGKPVSSMSLRDRESTAYMYGSTRDTSGKRSIDIDASQPTGVSASEARRPFFFCFTITKAK
jgi:hypothetical protein